MPTIIFKETEACNSNCAYCNVIARKRPLTISFELLEIVFSRINEYLVAHPEEYIKVVWHGGEPCIVGANFYRTAIKFLNENCRSTRRRIEFEVQSNLTLINQELIDLFKEMGINAVGTSYEPHDGIRGFGKERDSYAYNKAFFRGIDLVERNDMVWGFIYVVTKRVLDDPLGLFYQLVNFSGISGFDLHPVYGHKHEDPNGVLISAKEFADFLGVICKEWWLHRDRYPRVDPFTSFYEKYTHKNNGLVCCDDDCSNTHLYIGPSGELSHCGRSSEWDVFDCGNIKDMSIDEAFALPYRSVIKKRNAELVNSECKGCEYWSICHAGCPLDGWNKTGDITSKTEWCLATSYFLKEYFEPITGLSF